MPETPGPDDPLVNGDVRYEKTDVNIKAIVLFGVGLAILAVVVQVGVAWLMEGLGRRAERQRPVLPPLAAEERARLPQDLSRIPEPRLQESQTVDMDTLRKAEEYHLKTFGWVDAKAGVVRIPIADAMQMLADPKTAAAHGIRVQQAPASDKATAGGKQ
jgi:hypothetical protein